MSYRKLHHKVTGLSQRLFIDRELFLRADGRVQYLRVTRRLQVSIATAAILAAAWTIYASVNVVFHNQIVAAKENKIERHKLAYLDLLTEVSEYHDQFTQITHNLEENQNYLLSLLARSGKNEDELADTESQLKQSETERARVSIAREGLRRRLTMFESELNQFAGGDPVLESKMAKVTATFAPGASEQAKVAQAREHLTRRMRQVEAELAEVTKSKGQLEQSLANLNHDLAQSQEARRGLVKDKTVLRSNVDRLKHQIGSANDRQTMLESQIAALDSSLGEATGRSEKLANERNFLDSRITGLEHRLIGMRDTQQAMVDRLSERTLLSIDTFERTVAMTGLDVDALLSGVATEAANVGADQGGPFIPGDYVVEADPIQSLQGSIAMLDLQMDRWEGLQELVRSLPLTSPLDQFRVTSSFGIRRDPVNGRKSSHHGLDLGAPMHTPILSTAPGRVVFAGWKGRYGRTIVIDHGHGIRTRFGHLRKILVKVGQKVGHREKIGLLGSSGRSTGPHVHYEVKVRGRPVDPMKFMKAGKHVFKG